MKYFMVNEEELKDLVSGYYTFSGQPVYKWVNDFLKSKTPVEQIGNAGWLEKEAVLNTEKYSGHNAIFYIEVIK